MKTKKRYITQKNPKKQNEIEIIEVTEVFIEKESDNVIKKRVVKISVLKEQEQQIEKGISKMQDKLSEIQKQIEICEMAKKKGEVSKKN